jgi:hypothetical protein
VTRVATPALLYSTRTLVCSGASPPSPLLLSCFLCALVPVCLCVYTCAPVPVFMHVSMHVHVHVPCLLLQGSVCLCASLIGLLSPWWLHSIEEQAGLPVPPVADVDVSLLREPEAYALAVEIARFPDIVAHAHTRSGPPF